MARQQASMGPRHFSRGIGRSKHQVAGYRRASMGPRHFSRGIEQGHSSAAGLGLELQWGHGISAVESGSVW